MGVIRQLLATSNDPVLTIVRLTVGLIIFPHGAQKLLGWFDGVGFEWMMAYFIRNGYGTVLGFIAITTEFFAPLALVVGLFGRVAAVGVIILMIVATLKVHLTNGFFMNWWGRPQGEGFEFHLLVIGLGLAVLIGGSGALSLDRVLARWVSSSVERPALAPAEA